jgi:hypothetical protein
MSTDLDVADEWVEGETAPRTYVLENVNKVTGTVVPENLTGKTVRLILRKQNGDLVNTDANVTLGVENGEIIFTPDPTDIVVSKSPLLARFEVTQAGKTKYFPKGKPDRWVVYRP